MIRSLTLSNCPIFQLSNCPIAQLSNCPNVQLSNCPIGRAGRSGTLRHTRHNLVGQCKIVVHKYNQVLPCDVLIVTADNNDVYSHFNLYYVCKKTIFILASFRGEMGHTVGEVGQPREIWDTCFSPCLPLSARL